VWARDGMSLDGICASHKLKVVLTFPDRMSCPPSFLAPSHLHPTRQHYATTYVTLVTVAPERLHSIAEHLHRAALNALVQSDRFLDHLLLRFLYTRAVTELQFDWAPRKPWRGTARQVEFCLAAGLDPNKVIMNDPCKLTRRTYIFHARAMMRAVIACEGLCSWMGRVLNPPLQRQASVGELGSLASTRPGHWLALGLATG
jgi:hypothetical protein